MNENNLALVSIIVTTKNEEHNIKNCLKSISLQDYPAIEIIVVDNNSDDRTKELSLAFTDKVFDKGPERSAQRNYGMIDIAQGQYVMFIDADMILSPSIVSGCVEALEAGQHVAMHIPEIVLGKNYFSQVRRFERTFYDGTVIDGARFFIKKVFVEVGGFDEDMSGPEDWDIDKKMKQVGTIGLLQHDGMSTAPDWEMNDFIAERGVEPPKYPAAIFHNESEFELGKYLKKKGYYAKSFDGYIKKWGENDSDIKRQFGLSYRFFGVFIEDGKWKKLIQSPHFTIGMYFLRFMVGLKFVLR